MYQRTPSALLTHENAHLITFNQNFEITIKSNN